MSVDSDPTAAESPPAPAELPWSPPNPSFAFVVNVGRLIGQDSFEIAPGLLLRRASPDERGIIKAMLGGSPLGFIQTLGTGLWEIQWPSAGGPLVRLPDTEWRYFVIAFEGFGHWLARVQEAFDIGPLEVEVGFIVHASQGLTTQFYPARFFHVMQEASPGNAAFFVDVSPAQVEATRRLAQKLEDHDHAVLNLEPLITQLRSLKALPHQSALRFLGYFAVLEALLTHAPKPSDPYDSITRQVKKKSHC